MKKLLACFALLLTMFVFVSCGEVDTPVDTLQTEKDQAVAAVNSKVAEVDLTKLSEAEYNQLVAIKESAIAEINAATSSSAISTAKANALASIAQFIRTEYKNASGVYSFVASSYEERTEILGILEKYAVNAGLTGITVYEDSGYILYNPNVTLGTENYITGYGFGALAEGRITGDLSGETNAAWKRYYHTYEQSDPKNLNYGDDKGSVVGDLTGYVFDGYWGTRMNETKDGYEWYSSLANEKPQPQDTSSVTGLAKTYKFEVKTGSQVKYGTNSSKFAAYNGREVQLEDYLTPYILLHTKAFGWARAAENLDDASAIAGMAQYYNSSENGYNETTWKNVGIKTSVENGKSYLTITFSQACSSFYAMYYLASSLYSPIPMDFIKELGQGDLAKGAAIWGKFDLEQGYTPVDTTLATGPYLVEVWEQDKQIVFGKNPNSHEKVLYQGVPGVHVAILPAIESDVEAALKEFEAGKLTSCGIPSTKLQELKNDPRAKRTVGSSTTKLNINTCTQEEWEYLFGENGTITQTPKSDYWQVKPALSNSDFIKGLSYAIDRKTFAENLGRTPSINYFGSAYMADPEEGIGYNDTQAHKDAVADLLEGTDGYGYSLEKARAYFRKACETLLASGAYKEGDVIEFEMAWQAESNVTLIQNPIVEFWKKAFNDPSVCGGKLTLEVTSYVPNLWSDVYYKKMMVGQFDMGFGGINGNSLNPLNFFEVLKSDNSSGFTLNWGVDTSKVSQELIYDGQAWSFDALWQASETGCLVENGVIAPLYDPEFVSSQYNEDGTATLVFKANAKQVEGKASTEFDGVVIFGYLPTGAYTEDLVDATYDPETDLITVTVDAETYEYYSQCVEGWPFGFDCYFTTIVLEIDSQSLKSVYVGLPR